MIKKCLFVVVLLELHSTNTMQQKSIKAPLSEATQKLFTELSNIVYRVYGTKYDLKAVFKAIQDGADINTLNTSGYTPLGLAVSQNEYDIAIELLKQKDVDVNVMEKMSYGYGNSGPQGPVIFSVLDRSFEHCTVDVFLKQMLLTKNVDLSLRNSRGYTPLQHALRVTYAQQNIGNCQGHYRKKMVLLKMLVTVSSPPDVQNLKNFVFIEKWRAWNSALNAWQTTPTNINPYTNLKDQDLQNFINIFAREPEAIITPEAVQFVVDVQRINLMPYFYQQLKHHDWFTKLEKRYPVVKACGDLLPNANISQDTAKAFLKIKNIEGDQHLATIKHAYAYAKTHDLKKVVNYILRYMQTVAALPGSMKDVSSIIATFSEGYEKSRDVDSQ